MSRYTPSKETYNPEMTSSSRLVKKPSNNEESTTMFSEFKLQYDELRLNYDKLRKEYDDLNREKRRLEIKAMNSNSEYYEKEIKRLRSEVEKYQEQNQENKHKYILAQNSKKQLEASLKVKSEELKSMIKDLSNAKIQNVELKHQNEEKEKMYNRIQSQFGRSNEQISQRYDESLSKLNKVENILKTKTLDCEQLSKNYEKLEKKFNELQEESRKQKQSFEDRIKALHKAIEGKDFELKSMRVQNSNNVQELQSEIEKYKSERASVELLTSKKVDDLNLVKTTRKMELDIVRLQDKKRDLEYTASKQASLIGQLQLKVEQDKARHQEQVKELEETISSLKHEKNELKKEYEKSNAELLREIDQLKLKMLNSSEVINHRAKGSEFEEILRIQLEENAKIRRELAFKIDEIYNIKADIEEIKVEKQNMQSQMEVLKKMKKSADKNNKIQMDIANQGIKNDLLSANRKIQVLEVKLNFKTKELKEKDSFIINSIVGRSRQEDVPIIMADLQRIFEANYIEKLVQANQRIDDLSRATH